MAAIKADKASTRKKRVKQNEKSLLAKRKQAIEKAVAFWNIHAVDMSDFKFNREEANER